MKRTRTRLLSALLMLCMVLSLLPTVALAADPIVIDTITTTELDAPVAGAMPDTTCTLSTGAILYEIGWAIPGELGWHDSSEPFAGETVYDAFVYVNPASGYDFANASAMSGKINGETVSVQNVGTRPNQRGVKYTFPATAAATVPGAPTDVTAVAGNGQATVSFTAPVNNGGAAITSYIVTSTPDGKTATGTGVSR